MPAKPRNYDRFKPFGALAVWWTALKVWSVILGVIGTLPLVAIRWRRSGRFDLGELLLVFVAIGSVPTALGCLKAAAFGDANVLPPDWPTYIAAAALGGGVYTVHWVATTYKKAIKEPVTPSPQSGGPPNVAG
jgi:hypothetical protein